MLGAYFPVLILLFLALVIAVAFVQLAKWLGPSRPTRIKHSVYESGMDPVGSARDRFSVKFYMVAMLFILFDIEVVFMYPWAVQYKQLGVYAFAEMVTFIIILFVGYIYVFKKGGFEWE